MKMNNRALGILLLIQIALAAALLTNRDRLSGYAESQKLLAFDSAKVDGLVLESGEADDAPIELRRGESVWTTAAGFPADTDRIDRLLADLESLERRIAVATTEASAKRLKVARSSFERHLRLTGDGDTLAELYVGSGAGAGRAHVRVASQDAIYAVALGTYQLPLSIADWQDKTILQFEPAEVARVELDGLSVRAKHPEASESGDEADDADGASEADDAEDAGQTVWLAENLAGEERFDAAVFKQQLDQLARLRFQQALSAEEAPAGEPANRVTVHLLDGRSHDYTIYPPVEASAHGEAADAASGGHRLIVSDHEAVFRLTQSVGDSLTEKWTRENFVTRPEPAEDEATVEAPEADEAASRDSTPKEEE